MHPLVVIFILGLILSLPKVPHLVRWGFGKDRLRYIEELKLHGQFENWKKENKYFLLAEDISKDGVIIGILLSFVVGYFNTQIGIVILHNIDWNCWHNRIRRLGYQNPTQRKNIAAHLIYKYASANAISAVKTINAGYP